MSYVMSANEASEGCLPFRVRRVQQYLSLIANELDRAALQLSITVWYTRYVPHRVAM
jgi:hypothetical protein